MEFPHLGTNCALTTCKQLDFLPLKCDACSKLFCKEHIKYTEHSCENSYKKVGEHIDRDCQSDPALAKRKAYLNRCSLKGCKQKELIPVRCDSCRQNFCLKHRHEQDHNCSAVVRGSGTGGKTSASVKAGEAATTRAMKSSSSKVNQTKPQMTALSSIGRDLDRSRRERQQQTRAPQSTGIPRPALSEDEALALAIQASLQDQTKTQSTSSPQTTQEEEDRALAQALAESEREEQNRRRQQQRQQEKKSDCCVT
ncbi:AN1-type zinc finger protein 2B-like isoform X3 [Porites lutea]|uniref:AN1-type zinc finger protein 2B-like isoform X3 n=1 Tax=Porites lutea TaxID=51062 RepID=UPI003CC698E8